MLPELLALLGGAKKAAAGTDVVKDWGQFGTDMGANFLGNAAQGKVSPSTSQHASRGWDYAKAPDMSNYATIANTQQWTKPHQQRPQPQMGQMDMIQMPQTMPMTQNKYLRSLILGG